jgi:hypothetical protein
MDTIEIKYLKELFNLVIEKLEKEYGNEISFSNDYYWSLDENEVYNPDEEPKDFSLGQISFDIENLERLKTKTEPLLSNDLITIAEILKAIRIESIGKF